MVNAYGTRVRRVLAQVRTPGDLGPTLAADLTGAEVRYLIEHEWAQTEDDVLLRRSKLALQCTREDRFRLGTFMAGAIGNTAAR